MTIDERLNQLTQAVADFERVTRQGFATLTELHVDSQREIAGVHREVAELHREMAETQRVMQKLGNAMSALADHIASYETRLDNLEDPTG